MEKIEIKIIVSYAGNNYCAGVDNIPCVATGKTLVEVKNNIAEALDFHLEGLELNGETLPVERGEYELVFEHTAQALLQCNKNIVTFSKLSKVTGINQALLSHYANGQRHPRPQQREKIIKGLHKIGQDLMELA